MLGTLLQNRYRLDEELGRGGMGLIYRAYDTLLDRDVAVKVLTESSLGTQGRARLLREAQAVAKLNHPNIVSLYDAGEANGVPFLVMELISGQSLRDCPPASLDETLRLMQQVCAALEHAHAHAVVHRDLKPENVLITPDGNAKLVDFGLAYSGATRASVEGALVGTVFYLAPEQALGQEVDARTDLYALGVMLYELTAGRLPFVADDPIAVISQHLYAPIVPPSTFNAAIPASLDQLIVQLLSKQAADRPASATEVKQLLEMLGLAASEPVAAPSKPNDSALLDRIVRGRLVGRQTELSQLHELWTLAQRESHSHLALISGEPGVGKTRLAHEVMVYAQLNGALVLQGGCYEYEATTPYLPLAEALRDWVSGQSVENLRSRLGSTAYELARLIPEIEVKLGPLPPSPPLPPDDERLRLFDQVARFLQKIAAERGLLLFLDDLHWADHGTIALLSYLMRRLRHERALVLAAYREVELDRTHPLADALVEWNRERLAIRIPLGRLSLDATSMLLAALLGLGDVTAEFAQLVYQETEGNPFFVEEVVKSLIEQGQIYHEGDHWERKQLGELSVPQSVREAIGRRLSRLSKTCIETLHTAAALGKTFVFGELAAASSVSEDHLLDALDEASYAQLIRSERDEAFIFTHDKIREVLYEELNPIRRRRLHQRIGEGLIKLYGENVDAHVADLAHHFVESGDCVKGLHFLVCAAEQAERLFAHDVAVAHYERAVECAEALNQPGQIAAIETAVGDIYYWRGPIEQAVEHYQHALSHMTEPDKRAELKTKIGAAYAYMGDGRGVELLQAAERELDPVAQAGLLARALAMLGRFHHYRQEYGPATEYLERALQLAEPLDDTPTLTEIYAYLAGVYQWTGNWQKSMEWARCSIAMGERKDSLYAVAVGYERLAEDSYLLAQWQDALAYAARDREIGEKIGALARVAWAEASRAHAYQGLGDLRAALAAADTTVTFAERADDRRLVVLARSVRAQVQVDLGNDDAAQADVDFTLARANETGQAQLHAWANAAVAHICFQRQDWAGLLQLADRVTAFPGNPPIGWYVAAYYGLRRHEDLARLVAERPLVADAKAPLRFQADTWRLAGLADALLDAPDKAIQELDRSVQLYTQLGSQLDLGRVLIERGVLRQSLGDDDFARADWSRARSIFEGCGAVRDLARTQAALEEDH